MLVHCTAKVFPHGHTNTDVSQGETINGTETLCFHKQNPMHYHLIQLLKPSCLLSEV